MDALVDHGLVWGSLLSLLLYALYTRLTSKAPKLPDLPWIGTDPKKSFATIRANLNSIRNVRQWLAEGYNNYSLKGKSYIFPNLVGAPEIIVPRSQTQWLLEKPDNVLSTSAMHYDALAGDYAFISKRLLQDPYHEHVVHRNLARKLGSKLMEIWDEVKWSMDDNFGTKDSAEWKEICVFESMMRIIGRLSNRLFVGLPLCRNEDYLSGMRDFTQAIVPSSILLRFVPTFLRPVLGPLFTIPNRRAYWKTAKYTKPMIEERLANMERKRTDPSFVWEAPNDYITWHIEQARADGRYDELTVEMISRRLMPLNFAAIHTTALTITNILFDLFASDPTQGFGDGIREEATRIYRECDGKWDKAALSRMVRTDSAIRESMRVSNFMTRGIARKVVAPGGVTNEKEGWHVPEGSYVSMDVHSVQHDPTVYQDPESYDAFRFSRPREGIGRGEENEKRKDTEDMLRLKNLSLVTTGETFLPFGHGRHACPGRFFVSHELKLLIAYMVMNYEIEPLLQRPPNQWIGQNVIPPMKACIKVRRREAPNLG